MLLGLLFSSAHKVLGMNTKLARQGAEITSACPVSFYLPFYKVFGFEKIQVQEAAAFGLSIK